MKLVCPSCGCYGSPEAFMAEAEAGAEDLAALAMPREIAAEIQQYLRLFRPGERAMLARRRRKLLAELLPKIQAGKLDFDGRVWPAPLDYWREAIGQMIDGRAKLDLPMKTHNYLYRIVAGIANKADAQRERDQQTRATGATPIGTSAAHQPFAPAPQAEPARNPEAAAAAIAAAKSIVNKGAKA